MKTLWNISFILLCLLWPSFMNLSFSTLMIGLWRHKDILISFLDWKVLYHSFFFASNFILLAHSKTKMQLISMILCCMLDAFMLHWNIFIYIVFFRKIISCCRCLKWNVPAMRNFEHKYFMGIPWGICVVYFINQKYSRIVDNDGFLSASKWCIMVEFCWALWNSEHFIYQIIMADGNFPTSI